MLEHKVFLLSFSLLYLYLYLPLFSSVVSSEIPLGSKLSVGEENNFWVSSNGEFALGFFNYTDNPNQYIAGIRFNSNSIPLKERAVVWAAGADNFVGNKSYLQLTQFGDLVLYDSLKGYVTWTTNTSHFSVASALLQNDGNLIVKNRNGDVVWQSFMTPIDTLLPGQNLSASQLLQAASKNSVASFYTLAIVSGQLKLRWETDIVYWTTTRLGGLRGAIFTSDGALKLLDHNFNSIWSVFGADHNDSSVRFRFLRLDVDGNLRMYSWVEESKSWRWVWQAVENQCDVFATCGYSGVCVFTASGSTVCKCPFGPISTDPNLRCLAPYEEGKCDSGTSMVEVEHLFLYGLYPPKDVVTRTTLEECRKLCQDDSLCTSVTVTNDGTAQCRVKQTRYITGYAHPSVRSTSFVKICLDPIAVSPKNFTALSTPPLSLNHQSHRLCAFSLAVAASGTVFVLVIIQVGIGFFVFKRRKLMRKTANLAGNEWNSRGLTMLSYAEIKDLSESFKHSLGGKVFKGVLPNNQAVVIKDLKETIEEKEFRIALSVIGSIHHRNLVKLEGYCCESKHRFLVYEFAKNNSVNKWLEDAKLKKRMTWRKRMEICLGVARAMAYLHTDCRKFVCHGNLKWENVVLDEHFVPKVTEFGLAKMYNGCYNGAEDDIASFGKMVLIMVIGITQSDREISKFVYDEWKDGRGEAVVDSNIKAVADGDEVERVLRIALWCVQGRENLRPSMGEVVKVLEGTLTVDPPPPIYVFARDSGEEAQLEDD